MSRDIVMKTILLVEDDTLVSMNQSKMLKEAGYHVVPVLTAREGIAAVKAEQPPVDLVLMDIDLGRGAMDGADAAREILKIRDVPVIFLTAHSEREIVARTGRITNYGYVLKNSGDEVLLASISMAFRLHEAHRALRDSEEKYSKAFHISPDAVNINRVSDGVYFAVNEGFTRITGYTHGDVIGRPSTSKDLSIWVSDADRKRLVDGLRRDGEVVGLEAPFRCKNGKIITGLMSARTLTIDGEECILSITRDITDRKNAERALYVSHAALKSLVDSLPEAIIALDKDDLVRVWNPVAEKIFGWTAKEVVGKPYPLVPHEKAEEFRNSIAKILSGERLVEHETVRERKDGTLVDVRVSTALIPDAEGGPPLKLAMITDITEWKKDQMQLRQLSRVVEQSVSSIVITDLEGNIVYVNPKFTRLTGYTLEESIGKNPRILKSGATPPEEYKQMWDTIRSGGEWRGEFHNRKKNGELFWESALISPIKDPAGVVTHYLALKEEITEQKEMERRIREMEKMESLGTLAGGVAHDFNNILGIILGHVSLLEIRRNENSAFEQSIRSINSAIQRGAGLVRQILTFARKTEVHPESVDVNKSILDLSRMIQETFPRTIEIVLDLAERIPIISIDVTQLHQALLNLCINARDAMMEPRDGRSTAGKLTIRTTLVDGVVLSSREGADPSLQYVEISVADEGTGMNDATVQRIFEPFFTTKELGRGTGLGLSLVYGVVKTHSGFVDVDSRPGEGTVFRLYFPVSGTAAPGEEHNREHETPSQGKGEGVLIVEDEPTLLDLLESSFLDRGYRVFLASDGMEGVAVYRKHMSEIAVVLTDFGLPKADGGALLISLQSLNPSVKVVVASGFFDPHSRAELIRRGVRALVSKPYGLLEILAVVRKVIDGVQVTT
jgi:two-component system cell cycle sensor histidine kinase/response regulator CckA